MAGGSSEKRERIDFPPVYTSKIFDTWFALVPSDFRKLVDKRDRNGRRMETEKRFYAKTRRVGSSRRWRDVADVAAEKHVKKGRRKIVGETKQGKEPEHCEKNVYDR